MVLNLKDPATIKRLRKAIRSVIDARLDSIRTAIGREIDREIALIPMRQARDHIKDVNH